MSPSISTICHNLFTQTNLAKLEKMPDRGTRRITAKMVYRHNRRPGLVNPQPDSELPERQPNTRGRLVRTTQRPMRHVYKFHEPPPPKRRLAGNPPRLGHSSRPHRLLVNASVPPVVTSEAA